MKRIIILGPAYPYRGGIAAFNERLAREFSGQGHEVETVTFTLQYPSFLFPGETQFSTEQPPRDMKIERRINSISPLNWIRTARALRRKNADLLVIAFWMPYMGAALGTIARLSKTPTVALVHNLIPHEHKPGDALFSKYFCRSVDRFVALSESVKGDIRKFVPEKPVAVSPHPLYDNFGNAVSREEACARLGLDPADRILLSFGLVREYKGLDWLLEAFASLENRKHVKLVVAGEFYSDPEKYHTIARTLGIDDEVIWRSNFIPDSEVKYYFCAADLVVQPYKSATQSGVTQIAYHFDRPMIVTRVGGLAETVPDGKVGYCVEPSWQAVADGIARFLRDAPDFSEGLAEEKTKYSWTALTKILCE